MSNLKDEMDDLARDIKNGTAEHIKAGELTVEHIDSVIEFFFTYSVSNVLAKISGELRQISHDGNGTTIEITGWPERGELLEFQLGHDTPIEVQS